MDLHKIQLPDNHQAIIDRFLAACQVDTRIVAAFLGGSYAEERADEFSDLDLYFITSDEAYEDFLAAREVFVRLLGEPLFLEDFGAPHGYSIIFSNGTEAEIWFGRESNFKDIHEGPYVVLLDKKDILAEEVFPLHLANQAKQVEILRQQIDWFWHELSHFIKAMGRMQLWFAYGQLEVRRRICVNLARLQHNFSDACVGAEPYFKVEQALSIEQLSPLQTTYCSMEYQPMLQAGLVICQFYRELAASLAKAHNLTYQADLERMMINQLKELYDASLD